MKLFILFTVLTTLNVILSTVKSIVTIKCEKFVAALVNAVAYGLNTVVIIYTVCDLPLWLKVSVVAVTNFIGVFIVKWIEEKSRKERLWKIECTVTADMTEKLHKALDGCDIPHSFITDVGKYSIFNIYCARKEDTTVTHNILKMCEAKYFVTESKEL